MQKIHIILLAALVFAASVSAKEQEPLAYWNFDENDMYKIISFCKWCQHLPLPELAKTLKESGFDGVEMTNAVAKLPHLPKTNI